MMDIDFLNEEGFLRSSDNNVFVDAVYFEKQHAMHHIIRVSFKRLLYRYAEFYGANETLTQRVFDSAQAEVYMKIRLGKINLSQQNVFLMLFEKWKEGMLFGKMKEQFQKREEQVRRETINNYILNYQ